MPEIAAGLLNVVRVLVILQVLLQVDVRDKFGNAIPLESYGGSFDFASVIVTDATTGSARVSISALLVPVQRSHLNIASLRIVSRLM